MLKKSLFSPAQPQRAETHFFPCGVLASLEAQRTDYGKEPVSAGSGWVG